MLKTLATYLVSAVLACGGIAVSSPAMAEGGAVAAADYLKMQRLSDPRISPSGQQIVYERAEIDQQTDRWVTTLRLVNADGSNDRPFAQGREARWSPDGREIAYVAATTPGRPPQLRVKSVSGDAPDRQLTDLPDAPQDIGWSPDGKTIAFARRVPAPKTIWSVDAPSPPPGAKWSEPPRQIDRIHDRLDGPGFVEPTLLRMFAVPAAGGPVRQLTNGKWTVGRILDGVPFAVRWEWLPDGSGLVVEGYQGDLDRNFQDMGLYRVGLDGTVASLTTAPGTWASPVISPDGKLIAFMGHPADQHLMSMSNIYVMDLDGKNQRQIGSGIFWNPVISADQKLVWARDSSGVYYAPGLKGYANLAFAALRPSDSRVLTSGQQLIELGTVARNGHIAALRTTWDRPAEVVVLQASGKNTRISPVTRSNIWLDDIGLASREEFWVQAKDGPPVQAWLVKPHGFDPAKKYPLIVEIHGGPQTMYPGTFSLNWQIYASAGYAVLFMNPRGSIGYDDAFVHSVENGQYPGVEFPDLMAGLDRALASGFVDDKRLYVSGCSAGGTISAWAIAHTNRFAAASVRCVMADWVVMGGASDFPTLAFGSFDKPFWEDPQSWWNKSPLAHVQDVNTPTLIIHGGRDQRTPLAGASAFYRALKLRGVPTRMLVFEDEGHVFSRPSNVVRSTLYTLAWFNAFQLGTPARLP